MKAQGSQRALRSRLVALAQLLVIVALAVYIVRDFDLEDFLHALSLVDPVDIMPVLVFEVLYYVSHAAAFWALCRKRFGLTFREALGSSMMAWLVDLLLPSAFVEGDVARFFFLKTRSDWASSLSYTLFFRLLISSTLVFFILFASLLALKTLSFYSSLALVYAAVIVLGAALSMAMGVVVFKPSVLKKPLLKLLRRAVPSRRLGKLEHDLEEFLAKVQDVAAEFRENAAWLLVAIAALMLQWVSGIMTPYFSLRAVGVEVDALSIAPGYTILTVFSLASIGVPFMLGSVDSALVTLYLILGVPKERALLATLLGRSITIFISLAMIYPLGIYYIKRTFSTSNLEDVKRALQRISQEYGVRMPFISG
uniref:Flippase-like domain-containing protein n=1 Tax=Thermofilum pendens TaxID=2269 RepID=A0A7C3WM80_THEPE